MLSNQVTIVPQPLCNHSATSCNRVTTESEPSQYVGQRRGSSTVAAYLHCNASIVSGTGLSRDFHTSAFWAVAGRSKEGMSAARYPKHKLLCGCIYLHVRQPRLLVYGHHRVSCMQLVGLRLRAVMLVLDHIKHNSFASGRLSREFRPQALLRCTLAVSQTSLQVPTAPRPQVRYEGTDQYYHASLVGIDSVSARVRTESERLQEVVTRVRTESERLQEVVTRVRTESERLQEVATRVRTESERLQEVATRVREVVTRAGT